MYCEHVRDFRVSDDKKFSIFFLLLPQDTREMEFAEGERKRNCSGRRGNGKSARYYDSTLTSPGKGRQTRNRREKNGSSFSRSTFHESYAPNDTLMLQMYIDASDIKRLAE